MKLDIVVDMKSNYWIVVPIGIIMAIFYNWLLTNIFILLYIIIIISHLFYKAIKALRINLNLMKSSLLFSPHTWSVEANFQ